MVQPKNLPRSVQRQIDLTTAVCQERLLSTHVRHVLALVDLVSDQLPFDDALDIYVRILRLTPEQARNVGSRALAELGRRAGAGGAAREGATAYREREAEPVEELESSGQGGRSDTMFARLSRRIRGRVKEDLRHRIDLAAARTEDAVLETHVENALTFVKALSDDVSEPEAVDIYLDLMGIPEGVGDVIYNRVLRSIADAVLPPVPHTSERGRSAGSSTRADASPGVEIATEPR